jgi:hypothetical protein
MDSGWQTMSYRLDGEIHEALLIELPGQAFHAFGGKNPP